MLLVAVSGGVDSMTLAEKVRLSGEPFAIAHCNFGLRGEESDSDEAFVRNWADAHGLPCHVRRFDTRTYAARESISIEMAARRLRYHWFGELCRRFDYEAVAVAHNANDNAETLILNLLRGTGIKGLMGMKADGFIPDPDFSDIPLKRPLLGLTRDEIEAFAREHGLSWREDSSNALNDARRNIIRNLVFPVFREINPSFVQTLNRDMERFAQELAQGVGPGPVAGSGLGPVSGGGPGPASVPLNSLEGIVGGPGPADRIGPGPAVGAGPGPATNWAMTEEPWDGSQPVKQPAGELILDAGRLEEPVVKNLLERGADAFGRWETGDWIRPLGAPGRKKMQDWFTDHHIPADEKPLVPLLKSTRDPHHVLAVIPWCIDHSVRVTACTRRIIRISVKND